MQPIFNLTLWQKKQATLLYHFASLDYLKGLQQRVNELVHFGDQTADLAIKENRDSVLVSKRWGNRDTVDNWVNNAWAFLKDYQQWIAKSIADRVTETYHTSGNNSCMRGLGEYSTRWATVEEEEKFEAMCAAVSEYARNIDLTMSRSGGNWDDFLMYDAWVKFKSQFPRIPKFKVRTDVEGESGKVPIRTGVYVSQDDPHGTLQFAWTGGGHGTLEDCATFNDLGLDALSRIGQSNLWADGNEMLKVVKSHLSDPLLLADPTLPECQTPELAVGLVASNAFTSRPCKWYYVELVNDEYEDLVESTEPHLSDRIKAGQPCPKAGVWASQDVKSMERYYKAGETMLDLNSAYGLTLWKWAREK